MRQVVIYTRDGCCLCDRALEVLERVRTSHPFGLEQTDIESDERLLRAYLERIPVVTVDGVEAFEFFVDEDALMDLLQRGNPSRRKTAAEVE
jgi:glutaredoxin